MRSPGLLDVVREHPFVPSFPLWTCPWSVQLQFERHHELHAHALGLLFRSLFVEGSMRNMLLYQQISFTSERLLPL